MIKLNTYFFLCLLLLGASTACNKDYPIPTEPVMVFVQFGSFTKSANSAEESEQVSLGNFSIGKYPVTQAQWTAVMGSTVQQFVGSKAYGIGDNYPMYGVSWDDVQEYITKLNDLTGMNYRLPSEAEWEFAARGGNQSKGYKYSGSNNIDDVAWYYFNIPGYGAQPVGTKTPNELGIYDMSGNVWEWCSDCYVPYKADLADLPEFCVGRVLRGGAWDCNFGGSLLSYSYNAVHSQRNNAHGFRLAHSE